MHCHQTRWSYYHLNCHQFWQIPKKITLWGEIKSDKIVTWIFTKYGDHTITLIITNSGRSPRKSPYWVKKKVNKSSHWPSPNTGKFPQKSYYQSKPVISSLNFDRNCKKTTTVVSLYYNFIQPVGRASFCLAPVMDATKFVASMTGARQGWGSSHGLDEKATVLVNIKWRSWTNDRNTKPSGIIVTRIGEIFVT